MTGVKFCGLKREEDVAWAAGAGVDFIGFNFYRESPRFVPPEKFPPLARAAGSSRRVGVFVNAPIEEIIALSRGGLLDLLQLAGHESRRFCARCREETGLPVMRVFRPSARADIEKLGSWLDSVDYFLLDAPPVRGAKEVFGGTGREIDWAVASLAGGLGVPVFLAGGLTPENVARAISIVRPRAVDVASGIEDSPGVKNRRKMALFLAAVRAAPAGETGEKRAG